MYLSKYLSSSRPHLPSKIEFSINAIQSSGTTRTKELNIIGAIAGGEASNPQCCDNGTISHIMNHEYI